MSRGEQHLSSAQIDELHRDCIPGWWEWQHFLGTVCDQHTLLKTQYSLSQLVLLMKAERLLRPQPVYLRITEHLTKAQIKWPVNIFKIGIVRFST